MNTLVQIFIVIILVLLILYGRFGGRGDLYTKSRTTLSQFLTWFNRKLIPLFSKLNRFPFESTLIQFTIIYLIFFSIFITHPLPILKRWPKTTNTVLISILILLVLSLFIQFFVPFVGPLLPPGITGIRAQTQMLRRAGPPTRAGVGPPLLNVRTQTPIPFKPNIDHILRNLGHYLGFLMGIFVIILCAIGISYLAATHTTATLWISTLGIIVLSLFILYILYSFIKNSSAAGLPSFMDVILTTILFIPMSIYQAIARAIPNTSPAIFMLLAIEIAILFAYFIIPLIINAIYLKSPGNTGLTSALKLTQIKSTIKKEEEQLQDRKGGVYIDWHKALTMSDDDLRLQLFDAGYTTSNVDMILLFVRQNQEGIEEIFNRIKNLKAEEDILNIKLEKDNSTVMIQGPPIETDYKQAHGLFQKLKKRDDFNYQYTLSCWIMIHQQGPNHAISYNRFTNLLNYGNKPSIVYNAKKQMLRIIMLSGKKETVIYETTNFPLQKWNNVVMSYDKGTFDVFINGKLVASRPEIVPYIQLDNVITGEDDGISGGICNVVYYSGRLSQSRIQTYYDLLKDREPPVVYPIPFSNFFSNVRDMFTRGGSWSRDSGKHWWGNRAQ